MCHRASWCSSQVAAARPHEWRNQGIEPSLPGAIRGTGMAEWVRCSQLKNLDINIRLATGHLSAQPGVLLERQSAGQSPEEMAPLRVPDSTSSSREPTNQSLCKSQRPWTLHPAHWELHELWGRSGGSVGRHYCRECPRTEVEQVIHIASTSSPSHGPGEIHSLPVRSHGVMDPSPPVEIKYGAKSTDLRLQLETETD